MKTNQTKYAIPAKAVKILRRVEKMILEEPRRLAMDRWGETIDDTEFYLSDLGINQPAPPCQTVACIAGHVLIATAEGRKLLGCKQAKGQITCDWDRLGGVAGTVAREIMGLDYSADHLFTVHQWPSKFYQAYRESKTAKKRARITVERIEHFIQTGV